MITSTAPYAAADSIIKVLERYRSTTFGGGPVTPAIVQKLQMGEEVSRRVVLSLRQLELIDDEGMPTEALKAFERAPTDQYRSVLATHLRGVYAPVFAVLGSDISAATPIEVEDQFRELTPKTLRGRMARCFLGLCAYAGITETAAPDKSVSKSTRPAASRPQRANEDKRTPKGRPQGVDLISVKGASEAVSAILSSGGALIIAISGKVSDLTTEERSKIFALFDEVKTFGQPRALNAGQSTMKVTPETTGDLAQIFK